MGPYKRNWFVGGTVLLGLITLGVLIILFGGSLGSAFAGEKISVTFKCARADGINDGGAIRYLGQQVGTVKRVELKLTEQPNYVVVHAELDKEKPLPANVHGNITIPNFLGSGALIELVTVPGGDPNAKLVGGEEIATTYVGLAVLPPEFNDLAAQMRNAVASFNEAGVVGDLKSAVKNFDAQVSKVGKVMDDVHAVLGEQATQTDLRTAVAQFREAVEHANKVTANFERMSNEVKDFPAKADAILTDAKGAVADARGAIKTTQDKITLTADGVNRNLEKLAQLLDDAKQISAKINNGNGTIGLLLNDPKLYEKIVAATEVIEATVRDIQRTITGFEQDGVPLKLK